MEYKMSSILNNCTKARLKFHCSNRLNIQHTLTIEAIQYCASRHFMAQTDKLSCELRASRFN